MLKNVAVFSFLILSLQSCSTEKIISQMALEYGIEQPLIKQKHDAYTLAEEELKSALLSSESCYPFAGFNDLLLFKDQSGKIIAMNRPQSEGYTFICYDSAIDSVLACHFSIVVY